jgi:hypothetical protein
MDLEQIFEQYMSMNFVEQLIIFFTAIILIFLLLREVVCWYYKINKRVSLQKRQIELLELIAKKIDNIEPRNKRDN